MIKSLQGLRVLAMVGIFLFYCGLLLKGAFPVTFFLYYLDLLFIILIILR